MIVRMSIILVSIVNFCYWGKRDLSVTRITKTRFIAQFGTHAARHGNSELLCAVTDSLRCKINEGRCAVRQPQERTFVAPEAIRDTRIVDEPVEIAERLHALGATRSEEARFLPPADYQRNVYRDLAETVFRLMR
jgi:hypothetical protein